MGHTLCTAQGMAHLKTIFTGAFIICATLLTAAYFAVERHSAEASDTPLFHDSIHHLKELCYTKYRHSIRCLAYANYALRDSLPAHASLFKTIAHADAIHLDNCRHAIESLGGRLTLPTISPTRFTTTEEHLRHMLNAKTATHTQQMPLCIGQALNDNNRYVARLLTWCDACDAKVIMLLGRVISGTAEEHRRFWVCPTCGDVKWEEVGTLNCPYCMTDSTRFIEIKPFQ